MKQRHASVWITAGPLLLAVVLIGCSPKADHLASQREMATDGEIPAIVESPAHPAIEFLAHEHLPADKASLPKPATEDFTSADLNFDDTHSPDDENVDATHTANNAAAPPKILDDAFKVEEQFEDGSLKRRWFVRLYVTFDRSKSWQQQSPASWVQHGLFEEFYPGGQQLLAQGKYVEGMREGTWRFWHPGGAKAKEGKYVAAKLEGEWKYFRDDGTLSRIENYNAHRKQGTWKYFDVDGETVVREERYVDGERVAENASE